MHRRRDGLPGPGAGRDGARWLLHLRRLANRRPMGGGPLGKRVEEAVGAHQADDPLSRLGPCGLLRQHLGLQRGEQVRVAGAGADQPDDGRLRAVMLTAHSLPNSGPVAIGR
jgi:hypothetical protein